MVSTLGPNKCVLCSAHGALGLETEAVYAGFLLGCCQRI